MQVVMQSVKLLTCEDTYTGVFKAVLFLTENRK